MRSGYQYSDVHLGRVSSVNQRNDRFIGNKDDYIHYLETQVESLLKSASELKDYRERYQQQNERMNLLESYLQKLSHDLDSTQAYMKQQGKECGSAVASIHIALQDIAGKQEAHSMTISQLTELSSTIQSTVNTHSDRLNFIEEFSEKVADEINSSVDRSDTFRVEYIKKMEDLRDSFRASVEEVSSHLREKTSSFDNILEKIGSQDMKYNELRESTELLINTVNSVECSSIEARNKALESAESVNSAAQAAATALQLSEDSVRICQNISKSLGFILNENVPSSQSSFVTVEPHVPSTPESAFIRLRERLQSLDSSVALILSENERNKERLLQLETLSEAQKIEFTDKLASLGNSVHELGEQSALTASELEKGLIQHGKSLISLEQDQQSFSRKCSADLLALEARFSGMAAAIESAAVAAANDVPAAESAKIGTNTSETVGSVTFVSEPDPEHSLLHLSTSSSVPEEVNSGLLSSEGVRTKVPVTPGRGVLVGEIASLRATMTQLEARVFALESSVVDVRNGLRAPSLHSSHPVCSGAESEAVSQIADELHQFQQDFYALSRMVESSLADPSVRSPRPLQPQPPLPPVRPIQSPPVKDNRMEFSGLSFVSSANQSLNVSLGSSLNSSQASIIQTPSLISTNRLPQSQGPDISEFMQSLRLNAAEARTQSPSSPLSFEHSRRATKDKENGESHSFETAGATMSLESGKTALRPLQALLADSVDLLSQAAVPEGKSSSQVAAPDAKIVHQPNLHACESGAREDTPFHQIAGSVTLPARQYRPAPLARPLGRNQPVLSPLLLQKSLLKGASSPSSTSPPSASTSHSHHSQPSGGAGVNPLQKTAKAAQKPFLSGGNGTGNSKKVSDVKGKTEKNRILSRYYSSTDEDDDSIRRPFKLNLGSRGPNSAPTGFGS